MDDKEQNYRLTPKGLIASVVGIEAAELVWQRLIRFAQQRLDYEEDRGVPCLVLQDGGYVIAVTKEPSD